ncbi:MULTISPECIES: tyrosine-type recombinase/integrase [unclassified Mesorhizobium]|uniref:tyrosine-type recombinase/integrase n=1 Tax=unclassified Mesorhizobium TaxID=325217 RepID=UPI000FCBDB73|nr:MULTISPECIES: tyrosine-type recombinase/integrase [unclassified Mesorhizobium]RUW09401.1 integrase [Mesorhizobium sp. M1A.F.Ca.IN.020.03.1.1]RWF75488.1 MAG: integrase [Mesorhizobium sp.]RWG16716.1 MAG: integrase [Mesorhizobium sp.]RWG33433.1 MAG: integrase [Mesorhizobium sp.]RWH11593.1 MAG: integrase [Mesorhizobium sp.]
MKRRAGNPFPGVTRVVDRHGKARWRFRMKGVPGTYLQGEYGSVEFRRAYDAAVAGTTALVAPSRHQYGTFDWLIEHYRRSPKWKKLRPISQLNLGKEFDRFSTLHGKKRVAALRTDHVEAIIGKKADTPAAANRLLKLLRRLCRFAIRKKLIVVDPTIDVERYQENPDGFHTWTEAEILQFEEYHGVSSKAVLALRLILNTGAARQDVIRLGWQSTGEGRIAYRRLKTGGDVDLPILDELAEVLRPLPTNRLLFVTHTGDRAYKPTTFGNWFHDQCVDAGLPHCSSHGLRKAGATRLADAGATELEIMAYLGHRTPDEARTYTKKANRKRLGDTGMEKVARAKREQGLSNRVERLDIHRRKALKEKGN